MAIAVLGFLFTSFKTSIRAATVRQCTVIPLGGGEDDTGQINNAVAQCGTGGRISLPAHYTYSIQQVLRTHLVNSTLEASRSCVV
jgi:polygalacturonase